MDEGGEESVERAASVAKHGKARLLGVEFVDEGAKTRVEYGHRFEFRCDAARLLCQFWVKSRMHALTSQ